MGTLKDSNTSSDLKKWQKIFNAMVQMLQTQQTQIESFLKERKLLEERIKLQYDQISQMKRNFTVQEKMRFVESAKLDLLLSMKQRDAFVSKLKLENTSSDLEDLKASFDYLSHKSSLPQDIQNANNIKDEWQRCKALESEVRRLKSEIEKLVLNNNSEVSALLSEKNFVWNQYNMMEREKTNQIKTKCSEVELANEKIHNLLAGMEQLQSSVDEKDRMVVALQNNVAKLEADSLQKGEEVARLSRELELLRKSKSDSVTPVLRRCTVERTSRLGGKNSANDARNVVVKKEAFPVNDSEKRRNLKRTGTNATSIFETPKLFTASFKVPKLKRPSASHQCKELLTC